jgi:phospholipase/carboxylesterase
VRFVVRTVGAPSTERLPLIIALHGLGDSPENFIGLYTEMGLRVRVAAAAGLDRYGDGYSWFPSRAGTPHAAWVAGIRRAADAVIPEIRRVARENPTCGLPIVTGFSQGGMLSYAIVARPDGGVFAALPIGGLLPRELWPAARDIGGLLPAVHAFHGTADERVPFASDREANEAFRAVGYPAELHEYAGVGHTITPGMQSDVQARLRAALANVGCAN